MEPKKIAFTIHQRMSTDPVVVNQGVLRRVEAAVTVAQESIQNIDGSDLKGTNKFIDNTFKNSSNATITLPSVAGTLALLSDVESATMTLTNKTLTAPVISSIVNGAATITVPSTTGTLALMSDVQGADETIHTNINTLQQEINYLACRLEATLQYLKKWINAGNLAMSDIVTKVDAAVDAVSSSSSGSE